MQKLLFFASFFLLIQGTLSAQCLSQPACPPTALIFCDFTENNAHYWNDPAYYDPGASSHDLAEGMADLSMQIATSCDPAGVQVSFILILDLDGNGIRETAVTSDALPGTGLVYFGNAGNSNYTGGEARYFDSRPVPTDQKYEFALEKTVQDSVITVRVRWTTALAPTDYVWPELPGGTHRIEWRFEKDGEVKTCGYNFVVKDCQPPTVKCLHGLNINNLPNCMIYLWAVDFFLPDSLPVDNYSPANLLQFGIRRSGTGTGFPVNSPGVMFTAADLGIQPVEIMPNLHLQVNEIVEVPIRFLQANDYYGFQFGLHFDPAKVELLAVTPAGGTTDNFSVFSDCLHVSWSDAAPALFLPDVPILHLRIKALASVQLADVFSLKTAAVFPAEAYPVVDSLLRLSLEFGTTATTAPDAARQIFDPAPNPTTAGVRIPLRLEQSERVAVELLDGTGRSLYRQAQSKAAGAQWLEVPATAFPQAGVYFWRVQVGAVSRSGKVVKQ